MERNSPVKIWIIRHKPRRDPIFHHEDKFKGAGRSTIILLPDFNKKLVFRMGLRI